MPDRAQLEQFLQARHLDYDRAATDDDLQALVGSTQEADHARFLETYDPVITRLPAAVGSSPEQPAPVEEESEAQPPAQVEAQTESPAASSVAVEPAADVAQPAAPVQPEGAPEPGPDAEPAA